MDIMEDTFATSRISVIPARLEDSTARFEEADESVKRRIEGEYGIIFRGLFAKDELIELRQLVREWGSLNPVLPPGQSGSKPFLNFHRMDSGLVETIVPHIFHIYGFGDYENLPDPLRGKLLRISSLLMDFQNRLAGTSFELTSGEFKTNILRHPGGGGYLANHVHPLEPQKVSLFLNLSEPGTDYRSGEAKFKLDRNWVSTFDEFRMGDVLAWRYDLPHGVSIIDQEMELDWESDDGFWILALEILTSYPNSRRL